MTKKLLGLLILLSGVLYLSPVKADMGAPAQLQVDIVVAKQSGVEFTGNCSKNVDGVEQPCDVSSSEKTVVIPYNTKFTINYISDYSEQKTTFIDYKITEKEEFYDIEGNLILKDVVYRIFGEISLDNFVLLNKTFDLSEAVHFNTKQNIIIFNPNGKTKLYAGPSKLFDEVGAIPNNTKITYEYGAVEDPQGINGTMWGYVEYNGKKGWLLTEKMIFSSPKDHIVALEKNGRIMTSVDTVIREYPYESAKPLSIVPSETRLKYTYEAGTYIPSSGWYYIEYNGVKGWVNSVATATNINITTNNNTKIYKTADENSELANFTLPSGTVINSIYQSGFKVYYAYIEHEGKTGWIMVDMYCGYDENICEYEKIDYLEEEAIDPKLGEIEKVEEVKTEKKEVKKGIFANFNTKQILIICVSFALVIALTAFVTIKLVNRKQKNSEQKKEEEKTATKELNKEVKEVLTEAENVSSKMIEEKKDESESKTENKK